MEQLPQIHEVPDLQKVKLEKFLNEISFLFEGGFENIDGETLKNQFAEFFKTSTEVDFSKRLLTSYDLFNKWLGGNDFDKINKAASFSMPILRVIAERSLEISQRKNEPNNVIEFKK